MILVVTWIFLLRHKSQTVFTIFFFSNCLELNIMLRSQQSLLIMGLSLLIMIVKKLLAQEAIIHKRSCVYIPQQIGP